LQERILEMRGNSHRLSYSAGGAVKNISDSLSAFFAACAGRLGTHVD